jgi:FdhE protein
MSAADSSLSDIVRALASAGRASPHQLPSGVPDPVAAQARLAEGVPAMAGEPLLDWNALVRGVRTVAEMLRPTDVGAAALEVAARLERETEGAIADELVAASLAGAWPRVSELAPRLGLEDDALATVLDFAARPSLRAGAGALESLVSGARWTRGECPACGAAALLAVIRGKEHERRLHCGRCATSWPFPRVRCVACGETDHDRLGALHATGEGEYRRIEVCDGCGTYIKTLTLLDAPGYDRLLELDLETAALDFLALEQGYSRTHPARADFEFGDSA